MIISSTLFPVTSEGNLGSRAVAKLAEVVDPPVLARVAEADACVVVVLETDTLADVAGVTPIASGIDVAADTDEEIAEGAVGVPNIPLEDEAAVEAEAGAGNVGILNAVAAVDGPAAEEVAPIDEKNEVGAEAAGVGVTVAVAAEAVPLVVGVNAAVVPELGN